MHQLDDLAKIKKLDGGMVLDSIQLLDKQINQTWFDFKKVKIPAAYSRVNKIVVNGMGGSALGSDIIRTLFADELKVPLIITNSYDALGCVDDKTLFIVSSYSGTTEETLEAVKQAQKKKAKIFGITSGGVLGDMIAKKKIDGFVFDPKFNPSNQPRMGLGYSLTTQLALFSKLKLLKFGQNDIDQTIKAIVKYNRKFGVGVGLSTNLSKQLAISMQKKISVIVAAEFLGGNAHTLSNQINENAKSYCNYYLISEMNHHLLEGLTFPRDNQGVLNFLFFTSSLYHKKNQARFHITKDVVNKNKIKFFSYELTAKSRLGQAFEMLVFGSYFSFYLAILYQLNPSKIPWVDYFKAQLKNY